MEGLHDFPFDKLVCVAEIGSWAISGKYLKLELYNGGYSIGGSETSGESFSEFKLDGVEAVAVEYPPYPRSVICAYLHSPIFSTPTDTQRDIYPPTDGGSLQRSPRGLARRQVLHFVYAVVAALYSR